jgi:hypothetical protein
MSERPDIAGVLEALAALPDRTREQLAAYAVSLSAMEGAAAFYEDDEVEKFDEAVEHVLGLLAEANLSKAARKKISDVLEVDWPVAS